MPGLDQDVEPAQLPWADWKMGEMQLILQVLVKEVNFLLWTGYTGIPDYIP